MNRPRTIPVRQRREAKNEKDDNRAQVATSDTNQRTEAAGADERHADTEQ